MDLYEFQGKELFARWGIPVPAGKVAATADEAAEVAGEIGGKVVVKAQVQVGGRGKAGGIKVAGSADEARQVAEAILGMDIKGHTVRKVLIEEAFEIKSEYYAAITLDRSSASHLFMVSSKGGMDIEEVAATEPDALVKIGVDPLLGLQPFQVNRLIYRSGLDREAAKGAAKILAGMYRLYIEADASLVEINPMVLAADGRVLALDSKVTIDDSALFRQKEIEGYREVAAADPQERAAKERGLNFIKLDGDVGIIGNGAGLVMSTLDIVDQAGGRAANFLDVGGGAGADVLSNSLEVVLDDSKVRSVFVNIFGGITRCDEVAKGIVDALGRLDIQVPIVVRLDGTNAAEGRSILSEAAHPRIVPAETMAEAARKAVEATR